MDDIADRVRVASGGRLDITTTGAGEIVPALEILPAVRDGVAEMCMADTWAVQDEIGNVCYLITSTGTPGAPKAIDILAWYYVGGGDELVKEIFEPYGVDVGAGSFTTELFCHSNVKLLSTEDFKGVKFRTPGLWGEILTDYGASVIYLPGGEVYSAAETGILDAFEYSIPSVDWELGFHEITKYVGVPGIHNVGAMLNQVVGHDPWNELPDDLKALLKDEIKASVIHGWMEDVMRDAEAMEKYKDYGTEIVRLSDEFQEEAIKEGVRRLKEFAAEDPLFKKIFEHQAAFFKVWHGVTKVVTPEICLFDYVD